MDEKTVFLPAFGNRPSQLVGRDLVIKSFVEGLSQPVGHPDRATLLLGQRGMGKTALLLEFGDQAEQLGFVVARVTATDNMLEDLIGIIQRTGSSLVAKLPKVKGVSAGAFGFSVGLTFSDEVEKSFSFLNKLSLLVDELDKRDKGVVILIDEIQAKTEAMRTLTASYQHLVGEGKNVVIAMAGLPHAISDLLNDEVLTFFNRARKINLDPLSLNDVRIYYAKVFDELGIGISQADLEEAVEATRGYPYLLQLIGYYLLKYSQGPGPAPNRITHEHLEMAKTSSKWDMRENIYEPVLKPLSPKDLQFLQAMSMDKGPSRVGEIKERMHASAATVQIYRKRLIAAGVIAADRRGEVAFTLPYFGDYLRGEL